ncbi:MAG: hypothetical protein GTO45_30660, partial [Candidatus Aminicenantes bacterium]|nr:hypothetical protein [Candidatus Aminicenantes bacterium]NIM83154.1 hypothetical protein [Candidatus Aminicenantes bacterium]NIN22530.1 hypothetical protein [Candidatus Aminicenantes bacterium]NIN46301.1 hypothetical protein [Candidatus Aminicenantes bacterium]NIN89140.1 hypothetical protein [Candidatus Aminicenantes bacterium]
LDATSVRVKGRYAFVLSGEYYYYPRVLGPTIFELWIIDISNPTSPVPVSIYDLTDYYPGEVFVSGDYAYISDYNGLQVINISNPASPYLAGRYYSSDYSGIGYGVYAHGNYAYLAYGTRGVEVIDVSDPASLKRTGNIETSGTARGIHASGNYVYAADGTGGLKIVDIADPSTPSLEGHYETSKKLETQNVFVNGNYAYVGDRYLGFQVIDISNPSTPILKGRCDMSGWNKEIYVHGNYAYVANGYSGLKIIDVSNPASPTPAAVYNPSEKGYEYAYGVYLKGNYAYLAYGSGGLRILDVSNPLSPALVGRFDTSESSRGVYVQGHYAYVFVYSGLQVIDVSDPALPTSVGSCDFSETPNGIHVHGDYAYVSVPFALQVIDVSNPSSPSVVGSYRVSGIIEGVYFSGNYAFGAYLDGLEIIDVSDPTSPTLAAKYYTLNRAYDVYVGSNYVYLAAQEFLILELLTTASPPQIALNRTNFHFAVDHSSGATGSQTLFINNSGEGSLNWEITDDQDWLNCSPSFGSGNGVVFSSVDTSDLSPGTHTGTITVSDPSASNSPQTANVTLTVYDAGRTSVPFGEFTTPINRSTASGSVPFTGWVLDDIGVISVQLFREEGHSLKYIGDAVMVAGARPDIEQQYPDYPGNYRAGWGYMMLTNLLPGGEGIFTITIHAEATDAEGHRVTLGTKTITVDNANAIKPFGTIEIPAQGGAASGSSFINFGWVLTPLPNTIPGDGSTIQVMVDGVPVGNPVYNQYRQDIAQLFPGYNNSDGAVGYFYLDTTAYENGVHTIQWTVSDDAGNTDGIGSRYFTIQNTGEGKAQRIAHSAAHSAACRAYREQARLFRDPIRDISIDYSRPIKIRKGYNQNLEMETIYSDDKGTINIKIKELERIEVHLTLNTQHLTLKNTPPYRYTGYLVLKNTLKQLPIGSTLDAARGVFYWQPGPGFIGSYRLVFIEKAEDGYLTRRNILVTITPKSN